MIEQFIKTAEALAKPVEKLIEVVSSGIGIIYEPTRIRRRAQAEEDASLIRVRNEIRIEEERAVAKAFMERRENRRFRNLDSVIGAAREYLPESVSEAPVDPDWAATFFNNCQDVSNEQMQELWAKILAGEIAEPNSYSLKTLDVLRNIRKSDAELFARACEYAAKYPHGIAIPADGTRDYFNEKGLRYNSLRILNDLGLIIYEPDHYKFEAAKYVVLIYGGDTFHLSLPNKFFGSGYRPLPPSLSFFNLTVAGSELYPLCNAKSSPEFKDLLLRIWGKSDIVVKS